ncbi:unnamed protein product, partial [Linum tenue]
KKTTISVFRPLRFPISFLLRSLHCRPRVTQTSLPFAAAAAAAATARRAQHFAAMGNSSSMLTQYDIEEVQEHCNHAFSQQETVSLYQRFCQLDRSSGGFISADEFLSVPEFAVNPLAQRLLRTVDGLNFKEFVAFLSAFSPRATLQQKIEFIFKVYDSDGKGSVSFKDLFDVLRDLTGHFISEEQREQVLKQVLEEAGYRKDSSLVLADFVKILGNPGLKMEVEVPVD